MRVIAGFLCLLIPALAFAQARGDVESVGFGGAYRPGAWTPLVVRLTPTTGSNFTGRIEVTQYDLDQDYVIFTRQITLTGTPPSGSAQEYRFWMYFIPQPTPGATMDGSQTRDELTQMVKVKLCSDTGKELVTLPITQAVRPVESMRSGMGSSPRGFKFVVCVYDRNLPNLREYSDPVHWGLNEDVNFVGTRDIAAGLPDSVIGYDGVDAIVWTDADPFKLSPEQMTALEEFVRRGGKLVICQDTQTNQWQRNNAKFAMIMPVVVKGIDDRDDELDTLRNLAGRYPVTSWTFGRKNEWDRLQGPFRYAVADARPEATVAVWQQSDMKGTLWADQNGKALPYIARLPVGAGSVTWVAQDLGDKQLIGERLATTGWPEIWDKVMDWPNEPVPPKIGQNDNNAAQPYKPNATLEFGRAYLKNMDLPSTSAALIGIAVLFFIVYWVAAGPGSYLVLAKKGKASMSWFTFAVMAIAATGLTYVIVKLVLRGDAKLQHYSLVRMVPGQPISVRSNFGLYIPRDGYQKIELKDATADKASYVIPFNIHPAFLTDSAEFPAKQTYYVPVKAMQEKDQGAADPKVIQVPYRSTLKKFSAQWNGTASASLPGGISGALKLNRDVPYISGALTNNTGKRLRMVYVAFHHPGMQIGENVVSQDYVLYISDWPAGSQIDLKDNFGVGSFLVKYNSDLFSNNVVRLRGPIAPDIRKDRNNNVPNTWTEFWYHQFRTNNSFEDRAIEDEDKLTPRTFPLLSFFDRIPVGQNERAQNARLDRVDVLRRGARYYDLSSAISGGNVVVTSVADSDSEPLPFPLEVQGDRMDKSGSKGIVYYQFVLPVDRSAVAKPPPATQPTTRPSKSATKPSTQPVRTTGTQ